MFTCRNEYVMFFCEDHDFHGSSVNDDFDRPSSAKEVLKATTLPPPQKKTTTKNNNTIKHMRWTVF